MRPPRRSHGTGTPRDARRPRPARRNPPRLEALEGRTVLSLTSAVNASGVLKIVGDAANDVVNVTQVGAASVSVNGGAAVTGVTAVWVYGKDGDDYVDLSGLVDIPARVEGGLGNDTIAGGGGNDTLYGGSSPDVAGDGDDLIFGNGGDDLILGQHGNDTVYGGDGDDNIQGNSGDDFLYGDAGNDSVFGGTGSDHLEGGDGSDFLRAYGDPTDPTDNAIMFGGADNDSLYGGAGDDTLIGGSGLDVLIANGGDNVIAQEGPDGSTTFTFYRGLLTVCDSDYANTIRLTLDPNNNVCVNGARVGDLLGTPVDTTTCTGIVVKGNGGDDVFDASNFGAFGKGVTLQGGLGDDTYVFADQTATRQSFVVDEVHGGGGTDTLDFSRTTLGINVSLSRASAYGSRTVAFFGNASTSAFVLTSPVDGNDSDGLENIIGGSGNDSLVGNAANNVITGNGGNDLLVGAAGNDTVYGNGGDDVIYGGVSGNNAAADGDDLLDGGAGNDTVLGQAGNDTIFGGDGNDNLQGGVGNDVLLGGDGNDSVIGGAGNDLVIGGLGADALVGNADDDILIAGGVNFGDAAATDAALAAIMAEWTSGKSYATRVANLKGAGSGGANGTTFLTVNSPGATVVNDDSIDLLTGGTSGSAVDSAGNDWFFANLTDADPSKKDRVTDWASLTDAERNSLMELNS